MLRLEDGKGPPRFLSLAGIWSLRLEFAPTRSERNPFRCRLELASGERLEFFNRRYLGLNGFHDTSAEYTAFVRTLVAALQQHSPSCQFLAGRSAGAYLANVLVAAGLVVGLMAIAGWMFLHGLVWLVAVKGGLLAFYLPTLMRWLTRNRPHAFAPGAIPAELLPPPARRRG